MKLEYLTELNANQYILGLKLNCVYPCKIGVMEKAEHTAFYHKSILFWKRP